MEKDFSERYFQRYHRINAEHPIEVVSWRGIVSGPQPKIHLKKTLRKKGLKDAIKCHRGVHDKTLRKFSKYPVYNRYAIPPGSIIHGPAIIEEEESTVVIDPNASLKADKYNNLTSTQKK